MELGLSVEGLQHGHQGVDIRYHRQQVVDLHTKEMEVHGQEEVVLARRLIHGRQLHLSGLVGKADFTQEQCAILHGHGAFEVVHVKVVVQGPLGVENEVEVNAFGHHERIVFLIFRLRFGR